MTRSKLTVVTRTIAGLLFFFFMLPAAGQTLKKPVPAPNQNNGGTQPWDQACASLDFNNYWVHFEWDPPLVESDNEFILELSDASGSFTEPVELARDGSKNTTFDFHFEFTIPETTSGENYRFRVRSTKPAKTSEISDAFPMYYMGKDSGLTIREKGTADFGDGYAQICDGNSLTLEVYNFANAGDYSYTWYRSGTPLSANGPEITVTQGGMYNVEIDYGSCSGSGNTLSNMIDVSVGTTQGIAINNPSTTTLCTGESELLVANISGMGYSYTWYKDGQVIQDSQVDADTFLVDADTPGFEGEYQVEIQGASICTERSAPVSMNSAGSFTVSLDHEDQLLQLPGLANILSVSTTASAPEYQWYKEGVEIAGATSKTLELTELEEAGAYMVRVTETGGSCTYSVDSPSITVSSPVRFDISIAHEDGYLDCASSSTTLGLDFIHAVTANGTTTDVTTLLETDFNYQWNRNGSPVSGATTKMLSLSNETENGTYTLSADLGDFSNTSDALEIRLNSGETLEINANSLVSCGPSSPVSLQADLELAAENHQWYNGDTLLDLQGTTIEVTEPGDYKLVVEREGCPLVSNTIEVRPLDASLVRFDNNGPIVFPEGSSKTITANGADSYSWYDSQNKELSDQPSLTLTQEGSYLLIARIGNCQVSRTFKVEYLDTFRVPNVISVNGDGINDQWILPNSYANKPGVRVIIYNQRGEEVFNQDTYRNNWPESSQRFEKQNMVFYFKIQEAGSILKQGTITVIR